MSPPEPIAIIGMSCRLPGGCNDSDGFWRFMSARKNAWSKIPSGRYAEDQHGDPDTARLDSFHSSGGHYIEQNVFDFDASFFSITTAEAIAMDPQQRLNLECAYEALENAGLPLERIAGSRFGVYAAASPSSYRDYLTRDMATGPMFQSAGNHPGNQANRISYVFDLRGPSMSLDTACSSGLTALDVAVKALRGRDCSSALVGGANLNIAPLHSVELSRLKLLSPAGRCYSFDERGKDGFGRGEGVAFLVLKPLSDAQKNGDSIRAIIRETGANANGRSQGMTAPSVTAQADLVKTTYLSAGLNPLDTRVVEAHGTGTAVGDPVEAEALAAAFDSASREKPLLIGSAKSNVGHLEAVSGFVALMKAILMVEKGLLAPTADFKQPKKSIDFEGLKLRVIDEMQPWPPGALRRMSICNYGFGGANGHVIIESVDNETSLDFEEVSPAARAWGLPKPMLFVLSARQKSAAEQQRARLLDYARMGHFMLAAGLSSLAFTLDQRRSKLKWRSAFAASSFTDVFAALSEPTAPVPSEDGHRAEIVWAFTGQGAQSARMSLELVDQFPVYRDAILACDQTLSEMGCQWSVQSALSEPHETTRVYTAEVSQPLCTAIQIALVELLRSWNLKPSAVVGHSSGEIAAAYAAGALSLEDSMRIAYYRGLVANMKTDGDPLGPGLMAALGTDSETAQSLIRDNTPDKGRAVVACYNSPGSVTISGDHAAVTAIEQAAKERSIFARALKVDVAYHSHHMSGPRADAYLKAIANIKPHRSTENVRFYSSVSGEFVEDTSVLDAQYWVSNMISPVKFLQALTKLAETSAVTHILEVGPHSLLKGPITQSLKSFGSKSASVQYLPTLVRGAGSLPLVASMGKLWTNGVSVDIKSINQYPEVRESQECRLLSDLPPYPWSRSRFKHESRLADTMMQSGFPRDPILGERVHQTSDLQPCWRNILRTQSLAWMQEHKFLGEALLPYSAYCYMAVEAVCQVAKDKGSTFDGYMLEDVRVSTPINVSADDGIEVITSLKSNAVHAEVNPLESTCFEISSYSQGTWTRHGTGMVRVVNSENTKDLFRPDSGAEQSLKSALRRDSGTDSNDGARQAESLYEALADCGVEYGKDFALVREAHRDGEWSARGSVELRLPDGAQDTRAIHPCLADAFGQICWNVLRSRDALNQTLVPVSLGRCYAPLYAGSPKSRSRLNVHGSVKPLGSSGSVSWDAATDSGLVIEGLVMQPYGSTQTRQASVEQPDCLQTSWVPCLDMLDPDGRKAFFQKIQSNDSNAERDPLSEYFRIMGYNNPDLKVAFIGGTSQEVLGAAVDALASPSGTTRKCLFAGLDFVSSSEEQTDCAKSLLKRFETLVKYPSLASLAEQSQADETTAIYDLIVLTPDQTEIQGLTTLLQSTAGLLKKGADLVVSLSRISIPMQEVGSIVEQHGFEASGHMLTNQSRPEKDCFMTRSQDARRTDPSSAYNVRVLFASQEFCYDMSSSVKGLLTNALGCRATLGSFSDILKDTTSEDDVAILLDFGPDSLLSTMDENALASIKSLASTRGFLWVTKGANSRSPSHHLVSGLARVLRRERPDLRLITLNFEDELADEVMTARIAEVAEKTLLLDQPTADNEFNMVQGELLVQRTIPNVAVDRLVKQEQGFEISHEQPWHQQGRALTLKKPANQDLNSISFVDDARVESHLQPHEVEIKVEAVGANFKDTLILLGQIKEGAVGGECGGTVSRVGSDVSSLKCGDRVAALSAWCYGHYTRCSEYTAAPIPANMSFVEAATLPISYCTAHYALYHLARISAGETILIHAGAGALGQAAIMLAHAAGAQVYTTVGSEEKRALVMREYGIPEENIFYSRNTSFRQAVMAATKGRGMDVVLNSLAGEQLRASWDCVADFGRMIEVGKRDILANSGLGMKHFERNASFMAFDLGNVASQKPQLFKSTFEDVMSILSRVGGKVHPVQPIKTFAFSEMAQALRLLGAGKTSGKLVVCAKDGERVTATAPPLPQTSFRPDASYLVTGGTGGIGLELCKWMARAGAKHVILASRRGRQTPGIEDAIHAIEKQHKDITVHIPVCDVSKADQVKNLVSYLSENGIPPIRGIFHGAVVLKDVIVDRMTVEDWQRVIEPKVAGAWNMHEYISSPSLDFFVMLSSVSHLMGVPSQSSYCAGGGYLEGLAHHRRSKGQSADVLELGIISDVGVFEANKELYKHNIRDMFEHVVPPAQVAAACKAAVAARLPIPTPVGIVAQPPGTDDPAWLGDVRFCLLRAPKDPNKAKGEAEAEAEPLLQRLQKAKASREAFSDVATGAVVGKLSSLFSLQPEDISASMALTELGIDSLVAIELRTWIWKEMGVRVTNSDLLGGASVSVLVQKLTDNAGVAT